MYETLHTFQTTLADLGIVPDIDEAVELYRDYDDMYAIAVIYVTQYGHLKNIVSKFPRLTNSDRVSFILEETTRALENYEIGAGAKIQTLVSTYVYRRCYAENKMREHQKRKIDYDPTINTSYEAYVENTTEKGGWVQSNYALENYLESQNLTETELKYCKIVSSGEYSPKDSDVARQMGVTPAAINYLRKKLARKLCVEELMEYCYI